MKILSLRKPVSPAVRTEIDEKHEIARQLLSLRCDAINVMVDLPRGRRAYWRKLVKDLGDTATDLAA